MQVFSLDELIFILCLNYSLYVYRNKTCVIRFSSESTARDRLERRIQVLPLIEDEQSSSVRTSGTIFHAVTIAASGYFMRPIYLPAVYRNSRICFS